jgi:uncharacterized SAM-binding protein YcdF (DUF218 family)
MVIILKPLSKKMYLLFLFILSVLIAVCLIAVAFDIVNYGKRDEKAPSDVAIVLGAATTNGEVSPVYRERINHAIWLYENGYVDYLILTGGFGDGNSVSDSEAAKRYAISRGIVDNVIFIEESSTITEENLEQAKIIMDNNSLNTAILVSDPLHMKRAMRMAGDYGIDALTSPTPTSMYRTPKTKLPFLLREEFFYIGYLIVSIFR